MKKPLLFLSVIFAGVILFSGNTVFAEEEIPSSSLFSPYTVEGMTPTGTQVTLFDYWLDKTDRNANDVYFYTADDDTGGINSNGHMFKFGKNMGYSSASIDAVSINAWTENTRPRTGIVKNKLQNGYPVFAPGLNANISNPPDFSTTGRKTTEEPTDYLFDPLIKHDGKMTFQNADGLFQIDNDGYFYYDSQKNYAWFDEASGLFRLYNTWGLKAGGTSPNGQFFPFNEPGQVFALDSNNKPLLSQDGLLTQKDLKSTDKSVRHYFGLTMKTRFTLKNNGHSYNGKPVTYEFSGDDDVWIFIDNVLVADLGGIHDKASLSIDFSDGTIHINKGLKGEVTSTLKKQFENAGEAMNPEEWRGNTFADKTYHTLSFFYLERGNTDSNLSLKYNLLPVPESEITKLDQEGNPVSGVTFELYPAKRTGSAENGYTYEPAVEKPVWTGTTDENGYLQMKDDTGVPHTFKEFFKEHNTPYFILREKDVPSGYYAVSDAYLRYDEATGVTLSDNIWDTASYAKAKVTTTATTTLYEMKEDGSKGGKLLDFADIDLQNEAPQIYAVIFKRTDMTDGYNDASKWSPVSGSLEKGFTIYNKHENMKENIEEAIKANGDAYTFALSVGGAFQVTVDELPGSIENYYWYLEKKNGASGIKDKDVEYTVNYYYRDKSGALHRVYTHDFDRDFSTHVYLSNIKNYLLVEKVNEDGLAMNGAEFSLYKAKDVEDLIKKDGTIDAGAITAKPYDSGKTAALKRGENGTGDKVTGDGLLLFPSKDKILPEGEYYLIETDSGNEKYSVNPHAVHVIVDSTGVYADAGIKGDDDGISTDRHVSSVLKSLVRYASDQGIDATLHNIKTQLLTSDVYPLNASGKWSAWDNNAVFPKELHLGYYPDRSQSYLGLDYDLTDKDESMIHAKTESGWNKLEVRQCLAHYTTGAKIVDLKDKDISKLFSSFLSVTVRNKPIPDKPVDPEEPDKPVDPEEPDKPVDPEEPDEPDTPVVPDVPDNPVIPDRPVISDKADNQHDEKTTQAEERISEKTGDASNLILWISLLALSGGALTGTLLIVSNRYKK